MPELASTPRRLQSSAGRGRAAIGRGPWVTIQVPHAGGREPLRWPGRGLLPSGAAGRVIMCGVTGLVLLLALAQLIHLAQLAVTLVSLLVVLRLLGFFNRKW